MTPIDDADPANRLASAPTPLEMRTIAIELSKPGLTARAAKHPAFARALARLLEWVRTSPDPIDRIRALAVLARLRRQQNRPFPSEVGIELARPIAPFTADPRSLEDPKERDYLAQGLGLVRFDAQLQYLAKLIAGEGQTKTDARDAASLVLLELSPSLDAALENLTEALNVLSHDTLDPATSRTRRLIRVLESLQIALRIADPAVGTQTGEAYARLLRSGLRSSTGRDVSIEITNVALGVLLAWVRPNFSAALSPETFRAVQELRKVFMPARWPDETRESRQSVGKLIREAVALLAQAGVTDDKLRQSLVLTVEEPAAAAMLRQLAHEKAGLQNHVRHWLETGRAIKPTSEAAGVTESILETIDRDLAEAFRESDAAYRALNSIGGDLQEAVALSNPTLTEALSLLRSRFSRLIRRVETVGAKRGFQLQGTAGDALEYAPADHAADEPIAGARVVRIVSPMVVRRSETGAPQLILKAKVEEA